MKIIILNYILIRSYVYYISKELPYKGKKLKNI